MHLMCIAQRRIRKALDLRVARFRLSRLGDFVFALMLREALQIDENI